MTFCLSTAFVLLALDGLSTLTPAFFGLTPTHSSQLISKVAFSLLYEACLDHPCRVGVS